MPKDGDEKNRGLLDGESGHLSQSVRWFDSSGARLGARLELPTAGKGHDVLGGAEGQGLNAE